MANQVLNISLSFSFVVSKSFNFYLISIEKQVRATVERAFWDAFEEKLNQDPPDLSMAYGMLSDLKEVYF